MPAPELFPLVMFPTSIASLAPRMDIVLAYAGLGPAQQLLPHFLALLAVVGAAVVAVVQWPLSALWRRLTQLRSGVKGELPKPSNAAGATESPSEGSPDQT